MSTGQQLCSVRRRSVETSWGSVVPKICLRRWFSASARWPVVYKVTEDEYRAALTRPGRVLVLTKESRLDSLPATQPPVRLREIARNHRHVLYERLPF